MGQVRLLEHKANKKIRLLMRQEKTLKIRANHIGQLLPPLQLKLFISWAAAEVPDNVLNGAKLSQVMLSTVTVVLITSPLC